MSNNTSRYLSRFIGASVGLLASVAIQLPVVADDTEIYQATLSATGSARPKVLIVVDDSGSMGIQAQAGGDKPDYDPNETYADAGFDDTKIYWSTDSSKPTSGTSRYFAATSNRCESSYSALANEGTVTTKAKRWQPSNGSFQTVTRNVCNGWAWWFYCFPNPPGWETETSTEWSGDAAGWESLSTSDQTPTHVDCEADVLGAEEGNGPSQANGLPNQPSAPGAPDSDAYTTSGTSNVTWGGTTYKWYTAHYLDWYYDSSIVTVAKTRLKVVQEVVNSLVNTNPSIDFGLAVFNDNTDGVPIQWCYNCVTINSEQDNGGRIIHAIIEDMTAADREALAGDSGLINDLEAGGATPLCESMYEAYRYLAGKTQVYGNKRDATTGHYSIGQDPRSDTPPPDSRAYVGGSGNTYKNPNSDCAYSYVILLTDGFPTFDRHANAAIESLTGQTCADYLSDETNPADGSRLMVKNCLPELTKYMANNDLDDDASNGDQFGITYTIGFATDQQMLQDAASNGKGEYFTADTTEELAAAFEAAVFSILSTETSFTSPSVAVNTFTRTESRNEVFFAMFKPDGTKNWPGNIKRLDIKRFVDGDDNVTKKLVDKNNVPAIDPDTGLIKATAETVWSTSQDGPKVNEGGVGQLLADTNLSTRADRLWTNTGPGGALQKFSTSNIDAAAYGFDVLFPANPLLALTTFWGVTTQAELNKSILWGIGYDTDDEDNDGNTSEKREWLMADILHSRPRVISYGARGSFTEANPDLRILVGTNAGFLHMFGNSDGEEDWAFFPKELGKVLTTRRENDPTSPRPYGIDSPPVVYSYDDNKDGTLDHSDGDKVWAFFGLRRGGSGLYALDVSNPNTPSFMWHIQSGDAGFTHLGQTWSVPRLARIPGYADSVTKIPKPVLIFGGGYDPNKDDHATLGSENDNVGTGIYIVDAETGDLVWSVTPGVDTATNMQATNLVHSIPAPVAILDSNGDQLIDRIYVGDTAGILWRVDMPGNSLPTSAQDTWRLTKVFAAVSGTRTQENDRRFFNQPDVVRVEFEGIPADAILIGTGDRTNPGAVDDSNAANTDAVQNEFYMIRDLGVMPYSTDKDCVADPSDFRCTLHMVNTDLYDATANLIQDGTEVEQGAAATALAGARGWRIQLVGEGEKSLSRSVTVQGKVFFGTFTPGIGQANLCEPASGLGKLYAVNLYDASSIFDFDNDDDLDRFMNLGNQIPDAPAIHVDEDGKITIIPPQGDRPGDDDLIGTGAEIPPAYGSYWYREEY